MPEINAARAFVLTLDDGSKKPIAKGVQTVDDHVADHWFTKANLIGAKPNPGAGTPAFMKAAAEERARIEAEHARLEAETQARVDASVREKMEAELGESIRVALERQAEAATKGEELKALGIPGLDALDALIDTRVEIIVAERLAAQAAGAARGGKASK